MFTLRKSKVLSFLLLFLCFTLFFSMLFVTTAQNYRRLSHQLKYRKFLELQKEKVQYEENFYEFNQEMNYFKTKNESKVVLGFVTCGTSSDRGGTLRQIYIDQTAVMIKSVLISAEIYNVQLVEFHHFLENPEDEEIFRKKFEEMGYPTETAADEYNREYEDQTKLQVKLYVYSIKDVRIPRKFKKQMIYHPRFRCGYIRFYFPSALPNVDALIHMDTDTIVTGNLMQVWNQFSKMNGTRQMIGVVNDMEPENNEFPEANEWVVGGIPHLTPKGFNSGLLWMNLTKMREYGWEERFTRVYQDYSRNIKDTVDQQVLNILLYYNPDLAQILPCNFNFGPSSCRAGFYCRAAVEDPLGIQLVHGNGYTFQKHQPLHGVYKYFKEVPFTGNSYAVKFFKENLMERIRDWYRDSHPNDTETAGSEKCKGPLSRLLFPNFF